MLPDEILNCNRCSLRANCNQPVPGTGLSPSPVMFIGEAPGEEEDKSGIPFKGKAGRLLTALIGTLNLSREAVYITNVVKCRPPRNQVPNPKYIKECASWLDLELAMVQPRIVVMLGATAVLRMLGQIGTMEHLHGRPVSNGNRIYLPVYHPAAALHDTAKLRQLYWDFEQLGRLLNGADPDSLSAKDEYPIPEYTRLNGLDLTTYSLAALDVETVNNRCWSVQISATPGNAWFPENIRFNENMTTIVHNYLYDSQFIDLPNPIDTMVMAYLLGLPQGLKELAYLLCGMKMSSYSEVTRPGRYSKSVAYLTSAATRQWPDPDPVPETKWDNKAGKIITKYRKPQNIGRKIRRILADSVDNPDTDPYQRWTQIGQAERSVVEDQYGILTDSSLADIDTDAAVQYACRDADATLRVYQKMQPMIDEAGLNFALYTDMAILPMVKEMMSLGVALDVPRFKMLSTRYETEMVAAAESAAQKVGHPFNPNSSQQVAELVYGDLGYKPTAYTATGLISTDDRELKKIDHPVIADILEYRRILKLKSTFVDAMLDKAQYDLGTNTHRIHTTLKTTRTETGRLASSDPNLQNIPVRDTKDIRGGFIASPGHVLLAPDYDQQEVKVTAHVSQCIRLIELLLNGGDIHTDTTTNIFGVTESMPEFSKYRYLAKRLNFGVIYDISPEGLAEDIRESSYDLEGDVPDWPVSECDRLIKEWYKLYPEVKDFRMEKIAQARRYGYVTDMFGRRRFVPEVLCPIRSIQEAGERQAGNMPIQAGSAGITKLAMGALWRTRPEGVRFLLQIHDEILLEVPEQMQHTAIEWLQGTMTDIVKISVPLTVSIKSGTRWGGLEKIK